MGRIKSKKYAGVYLNHLADGDISYSIIYKDGKKTKRFTVGKKSAGITETFCYNKRNEFINKLNIGIDPIAHKKKKQITTLDTLAQIYFNDKSDENKANKKQNGRYDLHIKKMLGDKDIHRITKEDVKSLQKNLLAKKKAPKTINGIITLLKAIINYSIKEKELNVINPVVGIKNLKTDDKRERFLSIDEVKLLIDNVKGDKLLYPFVKMALSTGARLESVLNIKKKDIDLVHNKVTIKDLKNGSTYTGFFSDDEYIEEVRESISTIGVNDYYIGGGAVHSPSRTIQRKLKPILDKLFNDGLDVRDAKNRVVIHTLRHTFASQLVISGVPIFTVKSLMNHGMIEMTMRYAKLAPDSGSRAVQGLYG